MANSQTDHYGLNQWAAEDPVLREEFNRDNAKVDAAIQAAAKWETLTSVTLTQAKSQIELDLSDLDLSRFLMLAVVGQFQVSSTCGAIVRLNRETGSSYVTSSSSGASQSFANKLISFSCDDDRLCALHLWLAGLTPLPDVGTSWYNILGWAYAASSDALDAQRGMLMTNSPTLQNIQIEIPDNYAEFLAGSRFVVAGLRL